MRTLVSIPREFSLQLWDHLHSQSEVEEVALGFASVKVYENDMWWALHSWEPVPPSDFHFRSKYYLELTDDAKARAIKHAWDTASSLLEFHSHPFTERGAAFSASDLEGLREFVPHIWWRLKGKPYAAFVVGRVDFDALVWKDDPRNPTTLSELHLGGEILTPTGLSLPRWRSRHDRESI